MTYVGGRSRKGFTLQEMLIVVLVMVVLLALSVVGLAAYLRQLRLAELDNSAKEIFLSAQNRAILLSGGQRLEGYVVKPENANRMTEIEVLPDAAEGTIQITAYYIHCTDENIGELLPRDSIDPALWDGDFYIIYEPESGSVVDVFYSDGTLPVGTDFSAFYRTWRAASKDRRMDSRPMIGYYGGESAQSGTTISLRTPVINIFNENTLRAEVTYWVPRTLAFLGQADYVELAVELTYEGKTITLELNDRDRREDPGTAYLAYTYTWTLDSLEEGKQFRDLFSASAVGGYGADFTISARVSYTGDELKVNGARKTAVGNSLFAEGSGAGTAYIACLRHLQNLDHDFSGVAGKTEAVQQREIPGVEGYSFQPIENTELDRYDGGSYPIRDLEIRAEGSEPAGLFGAFSDSVLEHIRLVNTEVVAETGPAGALVGQGSGLGLTDCQVYWENDSDQITNLREVLGDSEDGLVYQVTSAGAAGGLAGALTDASISGSSASTLVKSTAGSAGGLVGTGAGLTIQRSYAASYLSAPEAAGLVGNLTGSGALSASYAVGFIDSGTAAGARAAGLCLGGGRVEADNTYSAMLFTVADTVKNHPLCETVGDYKNTYYLDSDRFGFGTEENARAKTYHELTDPDQWGALFDGGTFVAKGAAQSHPYNLQTTLSLTTYNYPGLGELEHWGDWGAQFQDGSLVYYEQYDDGSYGFSGGSVSQLKDRPVVLDGYAVAYQSTETIASIGGTLEVTYQTAQGEKTERFRYSASEDIYTVPDATDTDEKPSYYYILPLPGQVVNTDYAAGDFYQKITITDVDVQGEAEKSYYYNPHFADAIQDYEEDLDLNQLIGRLQVKVRSPRHLYMLSRFSQYYASTHQYRFWQQLDLDYRTYRADYPQFSLQEPQSPIGLGEDAPFRGSYNGDFHTISGVQVASGDETDRTYTYVGLFGYSTGVLRNIVYQMDEDTGLSVVQSGSASTLYVGALVGYNGSTVENCAVSGARLQATCYEYSTVYLGGLAGRNEGVIRSSAAEAALVTADCSYSNAYAGGFVGRNDAGGIIEGCYAVGKVEVTRARYGTVYACGFAGRSESTLSRSYAAVSLTAAGEAERYGFCPDATTDCVYLNAGNFTYREEHYAAQYEDLYAQPVTWAQLSGTEENEWVSALGMAVPPVAAHDAEEPYPYPGAVTDGKGETVHYGLWPDRMDLGTMGIYYWEALSVGESVSYHISAISVDGGQVWQDSTLSTTHGDGGVVTEYGYGYFYQTGTQEPELTSESIGFTGSWDNDIPFQAEDEDNEAVNKALGELMAGRYTFRSYNTWGTKTDQQGLFPIQSGQAQSGEPPYGTWTLKGEETLKVQLNPFFANAMACVGADGDSVPTALPGTQANPYEVRSIDQLQFINWNYYAHSTARAMDAGNYDRFPYLSYGIENSLTHRPFHWEQTHDLEGEDGVAYTPIAEVYDKTTNQQGDLFGWFEGTYDGNAYLIADVNIKGGTSSCVGLFGAVFDGTLKNIVLYSTDGTAKVEGSDSGQSRWYAIGGLAGLAGSSANKGSSVVNCTVAGYTIIDSHQATSEGGWGGTGMGGLIGISDMNLEGCTAVTQLELRSVNNDNVRVGGLVGSCQGSINSCYSGGSILVAEDAVAKPMTPGGYPKGIYVGGIVGGIYMKPLKVGGGSEQVGRSGQDLQNRLNNCYTYVELPSPSDNPYIKGLYAVGGSGELNQYSWQDPSQYLNSDHGWSNYSNNYYLESVVLQNNGGTITLGRTDIRTDIGTAEVIPLTYEQFKDQDGLLKRLNDKGGGFSPVTTSTAGGDSLAGRYSYGIDESLLGLDYPFPTILTQSDGAGEVHVHYGAWPLEGIRRIYGARPVSLDLFADYDRQAGEAVWTETLTLSPGIDQQTGVWRAESQGEAAEGKVERGQNGEATLTITAKQAGSTVVTVYYDVGGSTYSLSIEVNVTARLRLAAQVPSPEVAVFCGDGFTTPLELRGQNEALPDELSKQISFTDFAVEFNSAYFTQAEIREEKDGLVLAAVSGTTAGATQMTVRYTFQYRGAEYTDTSILALNVAEAVVELKELTFQFDGGGQTQITKPYTGTGAGEFTLKRNGEDVAFTDLQLVDFAFDPEFYSQMILPEQAEDENGEPIPGTLSITAYQQQLYPTLAAVRVQFRFEAEGSIHTLWGDLRINITGPGGETLPTEETQP